LATPSDNHYTIGAVCSTMWEFKRFKHIEPSGMQFGCAPSWLNAGKPVSRNFCGTAVGMCCGRSKNLAVLLFLGLLMNPSNIPES
jgi:hypothetical protein